MEFTKIVKDNQEAFQPLLFGANLSDYSFALGAVEEDEAAGVVLFNYLEDALMLDYIYVSEKFRRRGIGTALVEEFLRLARYTSASALHINYPEKSEELHGFALSLGFRIFRDGMAYHVPAGAFLNSDNFNKLVQGTRKSRIISSAGLNKHEAELLMDEIDKQDMDPKIIADMAVSDELSFISWDDKNDRPASCILCEHNLDQITVLYLANFTKDPNRLVEVLRALKETIIRRKLEESELLFVTMTDDMRKVAEKLVSTVGGLKPECNVVSGIRMLA